MKWLDIVGPFAARVLAAMLGVLLAALLGAELAAQITGLEAEVLRSCVLLFRQPLLPQ